jgi:DNA-binding transcriptional MerR regulator
MFKAPKDHLLAYSQFSGHADALREAVLDASQLQGLNLPVSDLSERVIRYYASEGVIDKPDRVGRDAIYQFRHLLQILVCRLMQWEGFTIAQIAAFNQSTPTDDLRMRLLTAHPRKPTKAQDLIRQFRQGTDKDEASGLLMNRRTTTSKPFSAPEEEEEPTILYSQPISMAKTRPESQAPAHKTPRPKERQIERAAMATPPAIPAVDMHAALEGVRKAMEDIQRQTEYQHRELMERMQRAFKDIERISDQMHHLEKEQRSATAKLNEQIEKLLDAVDTSSTTRRTSHTSNPGESK